MGSDVFFLYDQRCAYRGSDQPSELLRENPDAVIVAVGADNFVPPIPGAGGANVCDAWKILSGERDVRGRVVVIGGGLVGCETAEYLAAQGCDVTIVEMLEKIATGESATVLPTLMESFRRHNVTSHTGATVQRIATDRILCRTSTGDALEIPCDYAVMATGARPAPFDAEPLKNAGIPVVWIGDCAGRAGDIGNAIRTAYDAACAI